MKRPILNLVLLAGLPLVSAARADGPGDGPSSQLAIGRTSKDFHFPLYKEGAIQARLSAASATGITLNRAETRELKIELYEREEVSTTITSPKADLYILDRKMRTHDTVQIANAHMEARAQSADFDLTTHKYVLRDRVHVVLKNFDAHPGTGGTLPNQPPRLVAPPPLETPATATEAPPDVPTLNLRSGGAGGSLLEMPGAAAARSPNPAPEAAPAPKPEAP